MDTAGTKGGGCNPGRALEVAEFATVTLAKVAAVGTVFGGLGAEVLEDAAGEHI